MKRIAFFDFCETLVNFQTADAFVDFIRKKEGRFQMKILNLFLIALGKLRVIAIFNKFFPDSGFPKRLKLLQLRGFTYEKLNREAELFYREKIKPNFISEVIKEMGKYTQQEYDLCIVSAGYSIYLKYFADDFRIKHLIATEIAFDKEGKRCLGTISGKDCIYLEKVKRIRAYFNGQEVDYTNSISYSDSISDLPLLQLTGKGVVISRAGSQVWSQQHNFKEIIWN